MRAPLVTVALLLACGPSQRAPGPRLPDTCHCPPAAPAETESPSSAPDPLDRLDCEKVDRKGYPGLMLCTYKNPGSPNTLTQEELDAGWLLLFNGVDLTGWRVHGSGRWRVADGVLIADAPSNVGATANAKGTMLGWLGTDEMYEDFELSIEYRLPERGDSGIAFRTPESLATWRHGFEIQLLDDAAWPGPDESNQRGFNWLKATPTGSLMEVAKAVYPEGTPLPPVNQWNRVEISALGAQIQISVNGTKVVDTQVDKTDKPRLGYIGLQYYFVDSKVEFRNIKIRPYLYGGPLFKHSEPDKRKQDGDKASGNK